MRNVIFNTQTKETTIIELPDVDEPIIEVVPVPTTEEVLDVLITVLVDKGVLY